MAAYIVFTRIKTLDQRELQLYWDGIQDTMKGPPFTGWGERSCNRRSWLRLRPLLLPRWRTALGG